ncbi:thiamine pyrophosphate-dependent dehydrogenase E1 component subunit alpha [Candidatus Latescibacterota bacterium]
MNMNERSMHLYKQLYLIRKSEELIIKYYPENEMKNPMHMSMGQEANAVGVCEALDACDQVLGTYRSHALFLAKTDDPDMFFGEMYGRANGTAKGKAGSMHLSCPEKGALVSSAIVGGCISVSAGVAFANKIKKNGRISCVFFGDGAMDEGTFWESINIASTMGLPVLFVLEDNKYAIHTKQDKREGYESITNVIDTFKCNVFKDDTNDVESIYRTAQEAIDKIYETGQPSFIQLECYRYLQHVGISEDFTAGYRPKTEFDKWYKRDCVKVQRNKLIEIGYSLGEIEKIEDAIDNRLEDSIQKSKIAAFPNIEDLYTGVFYEKN